DSKVGVSISRCGGDARGPSETTRPPRVNTLKEHSLRKLVITRPRFMNEIKVQLEKDLREAGWHSRGYIPHFDGRELPQFITHHLADSMPQSVLAQWKQEL